MKLDFRANSINLTKPEKCRCNIQNIKSELLDLNQGCGFEHLKSTTDALNLDSRELKIVTPAPPLDSKHLKITNLANYEVNT